MDEGVLLILRGVSLNDAGALEDMVSVRLLITANTVIAVQRRRLETFEARVAALDRGEGAQNIGAFILGLVEALRAAAEPILDALERAVDEFELSSLETDAPPTARERSRLNSARHDAILMRRHMHPQAEALRALAMMRPEWLAEKPLRGQLKEAADAFRRIGEDLDAVRARAVVVSDEAGLRVAEQTNRLVLRLSAISIVFLPLTFLTGLFGVNLGGIPAAEHPLAFTIYTISVAAVGVATLIWLRRRSLL
jgi:zinc transporter